MRRTGRRRIEQQPFDLFLFLIQHGLRWSERQLKTDDIFALYIVREVLCYLSIVSTYDDDGEKDFRFQLCGVDQLRQHVQFFERFHASLRIQVTVTSDQSGSAQLSKEFNKKKKLDKNEINNNLLDSRHLTNVRSK